MEQNKLSPADPNEVARKAKNQRYALLSAMFLMSMSAVGPGFITQTANFTVKLGAAFAFAIVISVLIDFVVQLNIWRIVTLTRMRASDVANAAIPGSGYLLAILVIVGGLFFNIGNIGGTGLGLNAVFGLDLKIGGAISAVFSIGIFLSKRAGLAVDRFIIFAGILMIVLTLYVAFVSGPPVGDALFGQEHLPAVTRAALTGIAVTGLMRYVLFLAILGVVASGVVIDTASQAANPAAQAFQAAAGDVGLRLFGIIFWAAAITSVIGAAYTSVSFITVFKQDISEHARNMATVVFIAISLVSYLLITTPPAAMLVFVGGLNGLILPIGLSIFLFAAWKREDLMGGYHYPRWLLALGVLVCLLTWYMGYKSAGTIFGLLGL
ncbi:MAG: divalent metal cation transporter [Rhizobium pusense]|nr:divalent metal cation transporter [Agrobacterium pusense]